MGIIIICIIIFFVIYKLTRKKNGQSPTSSTTKKTDTSISYTAPTISPDRRTTSTNKRAVFESKAEANYREMSTDIPTEEILVSEEPAKKCSIAHLGELTYSNITKKTPRDKLGNFVVIDTETTGLKPSNSEIISVAAIRFRDFRPVCKFTALLEPMKPIPEEATKINGITNGMVVGHPHFQQIAASLVEFIGTDNLVGHNLPFDLSFIVRYGADVTVQKRKYYDTLAIARRTVKQEKLKWDPELEDYIPVVERPGVENYKLGTLCDWYGIPHQDSHQSECDALATGFLFKQLSDDRM